MRSKAKPVHYEGPFAAADSRGSITATFTGPICCFSIPSATQLTRDRGAVTCKRCRKQLEREVKGSQALTAAQLFRVGALANRGAL